MNTKYEFAGQNEENLVYVRPVLVADLPEDVQREVEDIDTLYAVHRADGERLALVTERNMAFHLARENNLAPVTVH